MATYTKRGDSYYIRVSNGSDANGDRVRKSMTWKPSPGMTASQIKKELQQQIASYEKTVTAGELFNANMTLKEFSEIWLRDYGKAQLKTTTYRNYEKMLKNRILPVLGHMKLVKIKPQNILAFYNSFHLSEFNKHLRYQALTELKKIVRDKKLTYDKLSQLTGLSYNTVKHALDRKNVSSATKEAIVNALGNETEQYFEIATEDKPLSGSTVLYFHHILSSMFTTAVQWQMIPSNPCARVKPPKKSRKEAVYLEKEDVELLLECLEQEEPVYIALIQLYLFTGMRRGEALGLTWRDINFEKNLIGINKERVYVHNQGVIVDTPKNETSVRIIKVPVSVMDLLKAWKAQQEQNRRTYGDMYFVSDWVFTTVLGKPFHPDSVSSWFRKFIDKYELPKIHLHSLRHTNASLLIANGIDIKTVSKRLGHSSVQTTGVIYTHQIRMADENAADMLDLLFEEKQK